MDGAENDKGVPISQDHIAPGMPTNYADTKGIEAVGKARIDHYLAQITLQWHKKNREIQTKLSMTGNLGGSASLTQSLEALESLAKDHVEEMLSEIPKAVRTRGRTWQNLHAYAETRTEKHISNCSGLALKSMSKLGKSGQPIADKAMGRILADLKAMIILHQQGWSSPQPDTLEERHPIAMKIGLLLVSFLLGLSAAPMLSAINDWLGNTPN